MGDFISLSNRVLNYCPNVGIVLAEQFVSDSWKSLQALREWSFRRKSFTIAPPDMYNVGQVSTNVAIGAPTLLTGVGTNWTAGMIGRQIRVGGLLYPFYDIVGWLSPTALLIGQPWAGNDVVTQSYTIVQCYYPTPADFGYFYAVVSIKDSYRLWLNVSESDLAIYDPQRTNFGQTYAVVFRDYSPNYGGVIGPVIPVTNPAGPAPISTTTTGFNFVTNATYIIQVVNPGATGVATYRWMRAGQVAFSPDTLTDVVPLDLSDGVQVYWPDLVVYAAGDMFIINCTSQMTSGVPRYELWPAPTFAAYLYPAIYIAKESELTVDSPQLPPFMANRDDVLLEMALERCALFPGQDDTHVNIYHDLKQARYHREKYKDMLIDLERNDEEVGISLIDYQNLQDAPNPWATGQYRQTHAPFLNG